MFEAAVGHSASSRASLCAGLCVAFQARAPSRDDGVRFPGAVAPSHRKSSLSEKPSAAADGVREAEAREDPGSVRGARTETIPNQEIQTDFLLRDSVDLWINQYTTRKAFDLFYLTTSNYQKVVEQYDIFSQDKT